MPKEPFPFSDSVLHVLSPRGHLGPSRRGSLPFSSMAACVHQLFVVLNFVQTGLCMLVSAFLSRGVWVMSWEGVGRLKLVCLIFCLIHAGPSSNTATIGQKNVHRFPCARRCAQHDMCRREAE